MYIFFYSGDGSKNLEGWLFINGQQRLPVSGHKRRPRRGLRRIHVPTALLDVHFRLAVRPALFGRVFVYNDNTNNGSLQLRRPRGHYRHLCDGPASHVCSTEEQRNKKKFINEKNPKKRSEKKERKPKNRREKTDTAAAVVVIISYAYNSTETFLFVEKRSTMRATGPLSPVSINGHHCEININYYTTDRS